MSNVHPFPNLARPTGIPGPLGAIWRPRITPTRYEIRAHSMNGLLACELRMGQLAGDLDPEHVTRALAQVIGDCDPGAFALMVGQMGDEGG